MSATEFRWHGMGLLRNTGWSPLVEQPKVENQESGPHELPVREEFLETHHGQLY